MAISKIFVEPSRDRGAYRPRGPQLGIRTVQAVSAADGGMQAARHADETVPVGPAHASKSCANKEAMAGIGRRGFGKLPRTKSVRKLGRGDIVFIEMSPADQSHHYELSNQRYIRATLQPSFARVGIRQLDGASDTGLISFTGHIWQQNPRPHRHRRRRARG
jgi:hypothetical protein